MKRITLIALASLALFATAAVADQSSWGNNHMRGTANMRHNANSCDNCPMGGSMTGNRMMNGNQGMMGSNRMTNTAQNPTGVVGNSNWRANPSYQGQAAGSTGK